MRSLLGSSVISTSFPGGRFQLHPGEMPSVPVLDRKGHSTCFCSPLEPLQRPWPPFRGSPPWWRIPGERWSATRPWCYCYCSCAVVAVSSQLPLPPCPGQSLLHPRLSTTTLLTTRQGQEVGRGMRYSRTATDFLLFSGCCCEGVENCACPRQLPQNGRSRVAQSEVARCAPHKWGMGWYLYLRCLVGGGGGVGSGVGG